MESKTPEENPIRNAMLMGVQLAKIEFWTHQYEFSFQFWGAGQNNIFINRGHVEIASFGGFNTISEVLEYTIKWCEKANPRKKYPFIK